MVNPFYDEGKALKVVLVGLAKEYKGKHPINYIL